MYSGKDVRVLDPQTAQVQATKKDRIAMSGVQANAAVDLETAYQNYLVFLSNSVVCA